MVHGTFENWKLWKLLSNSIWQYQGKPKKTLKEIMCKNNNASLVCSVFTMWWKKYLSKCSLIINTCSWRDKLILYHCYLCLLSCKKKKLNSVLNSSQFLSTNTHASLAKEHYAFLGATERYDLSEPKEMLHWVLIQNNSIVQMTIARVKTNSKMKKMFH